MLDGNVPGLKNDQTSELPFFETRAADSPSVSASMITIDGFLGSV